MFITFPADVADALSPRPLQELRIIAQYLESAFRRLSSRPPRSMDGCLNTNTCNESPRADPAYLCPLCAVGFAVARYSSGFDEPTRKWLFGLGTVAKQAAVDCIEANPDAAAAEVVAELSTRAFQQRFTVQTAAEQEANALTLRCLRALKDCVPYSGRLHATVPDDMAAELVRRGWVAGGYVTPQGVFAREQHDRDLRAGARARAARTAG